MDKFPPLNLLKPGNKMEKDNTEELQSLAQKLQETLRALGAKVTVTEVSQGPTVTRYGLVLEPGVKICKINSLREEIKLCLGVADIRIDTPIPGKSVIGIEVPNKDNTMITLRELFESRKYRNADSKLAFTVGKDIEGQIIVADLDEMSHILIAGSIKSG